MRAIDGDALYKKLNDIRKQEVLIHGRSNNKDCCTLSTALFEIDCAPTIEPERKKGKYIDDRCSECGCYVYHGDVRNFCPMCGAKMNGGDQDE